MVRVSIIIPVYMSEKYLRKCLESCISQTLSEIEIILVNDASPDETNKIMQEYEDKYPELVRCVYLKENIRQGGARNIGIRMAKGSYVTFVDSDDWIESEMCKSMYQFAVDNRDDIVYCDNYAHTNKGILVSNRFPIQLIGEATKENIRKRIMTLRTGPVAALIKREIFADEECLFPEYNLAEDNAVTKLWMLKAKRIGKIEKAFYHYRLDYLSPSHEMIEKKYNSDVLYASIILSEKLRCWDSEEEYLEEIQVICAYYLLNYVTMYIEMGNFHNELQLEYDYNVCRRKILSINKDNSYFDRWFTPNQIELLVGGIDCYMPIDIGDIARYYKKNKSIIDSLITKEGLERVRIPVWSNTKFAEAFCKVFPSAYIIDEALDYEKNKIENVVTIKSAHNSNVRSLIPKADIIDVQYNLLMGMK